MCIRDRTDGLQGPGSEQFKLHGHQARQQLPGDKCRRVSGLPKQDFEGDDQDEHGCWKIWSLRLRSRDHLPEDTDNASGTATPPGHQAPTNRLKEGCNQVASPETTTLHTGASNRTDTTNLATTRPADRSTGDQTMLTQLPSEAQCPLSVRPKGTLSLCRTRPGKRNGTHWAQKQPSSSKTNRTGKHSHNLP